MGVYVYVARKRPTDVCLNDGSIVQAYPLTYVAKYVDFNWFFDKYVEWYNDYKPHRMQIARSQRAFEDVKVEYVYVSHLARNPVPLEGFELYKISSLVTADALAYDMDCESSCVGGPKIFWADCDSLGELQGSLVAPVRVGKEARPLDAYACYARDRVACLPEQTTRGVATMRLMKSRKVENVHVSPCSKSELVSGIEKELKSKRHGYPPLEKCTRGHLIEIAEDLNILIDLEERAYLKKVFKGANIDFNPNAPTYMLVRLAVKKSLDRYGIADFEALRKNLKKSPFQAYGRYAEGKAESV